MDKISKEDWLKQNAMEVAILDQVIDILKKFRDAAAISSYPGGLANLGIRKKQEFDNTGAVSGTISGAGTGYDWGNNE